MAPRFRAKVVEASNDLGSFQQLIGGYLEAIGTWPREPFVLLADEEGRLKGKEPVMRLPDGRMLVGTVVVVKRDGADFVDMTDEEVTEIQEALTGRSIWQAPVETS